MPPSNSIEKVGDILIVSFSTPPSLADYCAAIDEIAKHEDNLLRLWDMSCGFEMSSDDIARMAEYAKQKLSLPGSKVAVYAPQDLTFGLFRVNEIYRTHASVGYQVFRKKDEAIEWLKLS